MEERQLLTESEVRPAGYPWGPKTLQYWRYAGKGPKFVKIGARVYYRHQDLDEFIARNVRKSTSDRADAAA